MNTRTLLAAFAAATLTSFSTQAQVATSLVTTNDSYLLNSGNTAVTGLDTFNVNGNGGYSILVNNGGSGSSGTEWILGNANPGAASVLVQEGAVGGFTIDDFVAAPDIANNGTVAFRGRDNNGSTTRTVAFLGTSGFGVQDSGFTATGTAGGTFNIANRVTITADGSTIHFRSSYAPTGSTNTGSTALFTGNGSAAVLNFDNQTSTNSTLVGGSRISAAPSQDSYEFSADGSRFINVVTSGGLSRLVVGQSNPLTVTNPASAGSAATGGNGATWSSFSRTGIADDGTYMFTGLLGGATATTDSFLAIDGAIVLREGDSLVEGGTLSGNITTAELNNTGDWAGVWGVDSGSGAVNSILANGQVLLSLGDIVNYNGTLTTLTGISQGVDVLGITNADNTGIFDVYFKGTTALGEALFVVTIPEPTSALALLGLGGLTILRRRTA